MGLTFWDDVGYYIFWLISTCICRILSSAFYGKIVGWKKTLIIFAFYILLVGALIAFGFWT